MKPATAKSRPSLGAWSSAELGAFYLENRVELLRYATRLSGSPLRAEEIVQDALLKVLLAAPELDSASHGLAYFRRTIQSLVVDHLRREGRAPQLILLDEAIDDLESNSFFAPDLTDSLDKIEDGVIVREALSLLSPAERTALLMWEVDGKSRKEIAEHLGIRESALRQTLNRARLSLRRILSERIIDQAHGLTALDLLSHSYRRVSKAAQKSSRVALSLVLVLGAFFGLSNLMPVFHASNNESGIEKPTISNDRNLDEDSETPSRIFGDKDVSQSKVASDPMTASAKESQVINKPDESRQLFLLIPGLDEDGVPVNFSVSDSGGNSGDLVFGKRAAMTTETGLMLSNLVSSRSGGPNLILDQSVIVDGFGTSYVASASVGIDGYWKPLVITYVTSEIQRLADGNYLLTASLEVGGALEGGALLETPRSGRDLVEAPEFLTVRMLLDQSKTSILAQSVYISADSQEAGA